MAMASGGGPLLRPGGVYELKFGETFLPDGGASASGVAFHTLRYDFKPQSVPGKLDTYLAFGDGGDVTIAVPPESGSIQTAYKGSQKPVKGAKECLLFLDQKNGVLRLEQLSSSISVKKARGLEEDEKIQHINELIQQERKGATTLESSGSDSESAEESSSSDTSMESVEEKKDTGAPPEQSKGGNVHVHSKTAVKVPTPVTSSLPTSSKLDSSVLNRDLELSESSDDDDDEEE